jgi:hypothetical protein
MVNAAESSPAEKWSPPPLLRRWLEGFLFIGLWVAIGILFRLNTNAYLLLGVPLTLLFQVGVRRQPIRALWVRDAPPFRLRWVGTIVSVFLALIPALDLVESLVHQKWIQAGWELCALIGAFGAGYAIRYWSRSTVRPFFFCLVVAGSLGSAAFVLSQLEESPRLHANLVVGILSLLTYFPVIFVLEEVSFRGALDSHWYHPGDRLGWLSAILGSALWGLWHLPTIPAEQWGWSMVAQLVGFHTVIGVPMALGWRKSGNLAVPGFTHAYIDAVRNALMAG